MKPAINPPEPPPNPRAVIGANGGPPLEDSKAVTIEEARMVMRAVEYVQLFWPDLKSILIKHSKKHKAEMGWRICVSHALKHEVRLDALRLLLQLNRKTCSENQQRPELWAEYDAEFDADMEDFREVLYRHGRLNRERLAARIVHWVAVDPILRDLEKEEKEKQKTLGKKREADDWEAARARLEQIAALKAALKSGGVAAAEAIAAKHAGPEHLAKTLSDEAIDVIKDMIAHESANAKLVKKGRMAERKVASDYDTEGLEECLRLGLARAIVPHLSKDPDPGIGPTALAARVYVEAVATKRIVVKEKKAEKADAVPRPR